MIKIKVTGTRKEIAEALNAMIDADLCVFGSGNCYEGNCDECICKQVETEEVED